MENIYKCQILVNCTYQIIQDHIISRSPNKYSFVIYQLINIMKNENYLLQSFITYYKMDLQLEWDDVVQQHDDGDKIPQEIDKIDNFQVLNLLSNINNGQGKLFMIAYQDKVCAAKVFCKKRFFERQANILQKFINSSHIVNLQYRNKAAQILLKQGNRFQAIKMPVAFLKLEKNGNLLDFMVNCGQYLQKKMSVPNHFSMPFPIAKRLFHQLLTGVQQIHSHKIFHRDLKCSNILLDDRFRIKIADFGCAEYRGSSRLQGPQPGTSNYMAPEAYYKKFFNEKSDIFACGLIFFIMCFNCWFPFHPNGRHIKYFNDQKSKPKLWRGVQKATKEQVPSQVKQFFSMITSQQPNKRKNIQSILNSQFMASKASEQETQQFMKSWYSNFQKQDQLAQRIKAASSKLEQIIHQRNNSLQMEQTQTVDNRCFGLSSNFEKLLSYYNSVMIEKYNFDVTFNFHQKLAFSSTPSMILAWLHFYIDDFLGKNLQQILNRLIGYKLLEKKAILSQEKNKLRIILAFSIQSQNQEQFQQKYNRINIQVEGTLQRRQSDNKIIIKWREIGQNDDLIVNALLNQIKIASEALIQYEKSIKQNIQ